MELKRSDAAVKVVTIKLKKEVCVLSTEQR